MWLLVATEELLISMLIDATQCNKAGCIELTRTWDACVLLQHRCFQKWDVGETICCLHVTAYPVVLLVAMPCAEAVHAKNNADQMGGDLSCHSCLVGSYVPSIVLVLVLCNHLMVQLLLNHVQIII